MPNARPSETYHLLGDHDNSLGGESAVAVVEEILQTRTKKVDHENVVQPLLSKVINIRNAGCEKRLANRWSDMSTFGTYGIQPRSCTSGTRHAAEEHRSCVVPKIETIVSYNLFVGEAVKPFNRQCLLSTSLSMLGSQWR
jgi:hypothetical protein